jgi:hypothetical protein
LGSSGSAKVQWWVFEKRVSYGRDFVTSGTVVTFAGSSAILAVCRIFLKPYQFPKRKVAISTEKLIVAQAVRKFPYFMERGSSQSYLEETATGPNSEPYHSNSHSLYVRKIHSNIPSVQSAG